MADKFPQINKAISQSTQNYTTLSMNRPYYQTPKAGVVMRALWKCAGADRYLLERSTYSDQIKYMCMGGVVLATGVMAAMAGGYAFYTIFEPKGDAMQNYILEEYGKGSGYSDVVHTRTMVISSIFGLIWGLIIFNLDRFIVSSTGKGDGTEAITWDELKGALPRIFMGVIIAITISKPLEIRMFKSEIDAALSAKQLQLKRERKDAIESRYAVNMKYIADQIALIEKERDDIYNRLKLAEKEHTDQLQGRAGAPAGDGKLSQKLEGIKISIQNELSTYDAHHRDKLAELNDDKSKLKLQIESEVAKEDINVAGLDGLLERIKLAHEQAGWTISLFITLLFMAIELTPIFFKLMLVQGPYDYMSDNIKELIKAEHGVEVKYDYYKDKQGQERHLVVYHKPEIEIHEKSEWAKSQKEITSKAIEKWKEEQLKRVDEKLEDFITKE
jgi:hypothetical protein